MLRRLFLTFTCLLFLIIASLPAVAPAKAGDNLLKDKMDAIDQGGNQEAWLDEALTSNLVSATKGLVGKMEFNDDGTLKTKGWVPGGALGITTNLIASLYTPPASGVEYLANTWSNFLGSPVYAQGIGFKGLQPIVPIWRGFRNVVYTLSSVIFIVIGIMIMLRVKISPQAVVTLQNAIPTIITTLILVTFSYAIAGLLIDFMQVLQSAAIALMFSMQGKNLTQELFPAAGLLGSDNTNFQAFSSGGMGTIANLTKQAIPMAPFFFWATYFSVILGSVVVLASGGAALPTVAALAAGPVLIILIIAVLMLIWMFKFYFGCLKCYITAIFKIILAPLEIGLGAFPQSKMGFTTWFWDLLANLAVFPISMIFLVLANIIIESVKSGLWTPHIIGNLSLQTYTISLGALGVGNVVAIGIGIATVMIMSRLPEMIPQFIFMIKPSPWGQAIGQAMDFSRNPIYNFGKAAVKQEVGGPLVQEVGSRLAGSTGALSGIKLPWGKKPSLTKVAGDAISGIGQKIQEGKI